ncbi:tol-pal system protein YbgF [Thioalkalivibrio denitrificans]|uniref:Cell division coordinator CpoB n=1 Tax=Thioalkalivibrio denitrificans TaxID=108003 RepID=A0A1V3NL63_9GAMM|nr:tol-pal system protein YbgF [Thioalkalivibrio denitrificans]OOG25618.1 tol-pal system protein YbgF [Thioalkalivibrio denitrificans]
MTFLSRARLLLVPAVLLPALAVAQQQPPPPDPRQLDARIQRLERLMDNQALLDMMRRLDALEQEVRAMRGDAETNRHELESLRNRQRDLYLDVDSRLQALEEGGVQVSPGPARPDVPIVAEPGVPAEPGAPAVPAEGDQQAYRAAFDLLRDGRYEQSVWAFRSFLDDYPDSPLAANAQYWLGEAKYVSRDFENALAEFEKVMAEYPTSSKVPDAMLKLGFTHYELSQWQEAREALEQVVADHQGSAVARLAEQRLRRMRDEGR